MSTILINPKTATPCTFSRDNKIKFGLQTENGFVWVTQTVNVQDKENPFRTACIPVDNPIDKEEITAEMTKTDLEQRGLCGFSLKFATEWVSCMG